MASKRLSHYQEKITVEQLAETTGLNPDYFGTQFKKLTGYSIKEYVNRIRIHKAEDLLSTGGYTVSEAAYRCGFEDIFYFSKVFKKITGVCPSSLLK